MDRNQPGADEVCEVVKGVCVRDTVDGSIDGKKEEEDVCCVTKPIALVSSSLLRIVEGKKWSPNKNMGSRAKCEKATYRFVILGIIAPPVNDSTSSMKGIMDKTLWWDEKGVSQCTARLCTHTTRTGILMGRTHSIRTRIEWV